MIDIGDAYITMENMVAAVPQKSCLFFPWKASTEITAAIANAIITNINIANIFPFCLLGAYMKKINTYINSIAAPAPFIVAIRILFDDINGKPYLFIQSITYQ